MALPKYIRLVCGISLLAAATAIANNNNNTPRRMRIGSRSLDQQQPIATNNDNIPPSDKNEDYEWAADELHIFPEMATESQDRRRQTEFEWAEETNMSMNMLVDSDFSIPLTSKESFMSMDLIIEDEIIDTTPAPTIQVTTRIPTYMPSTSWPSFTPTLSPEMPLNQNIAGFVDTISSTNSPTSLSPTTGKPFIEIPTSYKPTTASPVSPVPTTKAAKVPPPSSSPATNVPTPSPTLPSCNQLNKKKCLKEMEETGRCIFIKNENEDFCIDVPPSSSPLSTLEPTLDVLEEIVSTQLPTSSSPTTMEPTSSSPTTNPPTSASPTLPIIEPINLETNIQLQLTTMSSEMNEESTNVFEQICNQFLNEMLVDASPSIFDVECIVTDQSLSELVRRRKLQSDVDQDNIILQRNREKYFEHRAAIEEEQQLLVFEEDKREEGQSLVVNVNVKGSTYPTDTVTEASDVPFDDLVRGTINVHSTQFVRELKADGYKMGIDDFNSLSSVYVIRPVNDGNSIESQTGTNGPDTGEGNSKGKAGAIAAIVISGVVILGMFGAYFYHVGKRSQDSVGSSDSSGIIDVYDNTLRELEANPTAGESCSSETYPSAQILSNNHQHDQLSEMTSPSSQQQLNMIPSQSSELTDDDAPFNDIRRFNSAVSGESRNDHMTYVYSLDDGLASPSSLLSQNVSPLSMAGKMQSQEAELQPQKRIRVDITAPSGKLGIIIDTCSEGPIVHSIKESSPLEGLIFKGDLVVAVDDEDTREWSAHFLTKLVAKKSRHVRKLSVMRNETEVSRESIVQQIVETVSSEESDE